jgi:hypothetical protein
VRRGAWGYARVILVVLAAVGAIALAGGCARDNGLPGELTKLLAGNGITVPVSGSEAPLSSRAGLVFFQADPTLERKIIAAFGLRRVEPESAEFEAAAARVAARPNALWGVAGRPAALKLPGGGQLENLYLLTTQDGRTYLLAEYAYG